jgi:hypothetical protein
MEGLKDAYYWWLHTLSDVERDRYIKKNYDSRRKG